MTTAAICFILSVAYVKLRGITKPEVFLDWIAPLIAILSLAIFMAGAFISIWF
jgi:hypothetical protein